MTAQGAAPVLLTGVVGSAALAAAYVKDALLRPRVNECFSFVPSFHFFRIRLVEDSRGCVGLAEFSSDFERLKMKMRYAKLTVLRRSALTASHARCIAKCNPCRMRRTATTRRHAVPTGRSVKGRVQTTLPAGPKSRLPLLRSVSGRVQCVS